MESICGKVSLDSKNKNSTGWYEMISSQFVGSKKDGKYSPPRL